jgi:hypothetical protein
VQFLRRLLYRRKMRREGFVNCGRFGSVRPLAPKLSNLRSEFLSRSRERFNSQALDSKLILAEFLRRRIALFSRSPYVLWFSPAVSE